MIILKLIITSLTLCLKYFLILDEEDNPEIETDDIQGVLYAKINIGSVP